MTEDIDFNRMSPAEQAIWRTEQVAKEEKAYQARMKRQSELQRMRTVAFSETKAQRQLVAKSLRGHSKLLVVVRGEAREATIRGGLVDEPGVLRGFFGGLELPNCLFLDLPEGLGRIREIFEAIGHPRDIKPFREKGLLNCGRHLANHEFLLVFRGLTLDDLGIEPCVCAPGGPGHRFKNISTSFLSLSPWSIEPGQEFDPSEGGQEIVEGYMAAGFVLDLKAPPKKAKKKEAKPKTPEEILEEAVSSWDDD